MDQSTYKALNICLTSPTTFNFKAGVFWNGLNFISMGISGVILNLLIMTKYNASTLGSFNQVYAIYILLSTIAVFGIYASVLKFTSEHFDNKQKLGEILPSGLALCILFSFVTCSFNYFTANYIGIILGSKEVAFGLRITTLGLFFFSINKVLLAFINGLRLMFYYALFNICRFILMPLSLIILLTQNFPGRFVPVLFSITETILFIILAIFCYQHIRGNFKIKLSWIRQHFLFGRKAFPGSAFSELNSRIDVLMLGIFVSDRLVGIYSFAAMIAEGFSQIPIIFQVNYNPILARMFFEGKLEELQAIMRKFLTKSYFISILLGVVIIGSFPIALALFRVIQNIYEMWLVFSILILGIVYKSRYAVFYDLPNQTGHPGYQSMLLIVVTISNLIFNLILIPFLSINGAAIATSISFVVSVLLFKYFLKRVLNLSFSY